MELASTLVEEGKQVVFTGTEDEGKQFRERIPGNENVIDSTGKLSLEQLMALIQNAKNLVACSTGPLHIAGYLGFYFRQANPLATPRAGCSAGDLCA